MCRTGIIEGVLRLEKGSVLVTFLMDSLIKVHPIAVLNRQPQVADSLYPECEISIMVTSGGERKRKGGPHVPVPRLV